MRPRLHTGCSRYFKLVSLFRQDTEHTCHVIATHCCGVTSMRMSKLHGHKKNTAAVLLALCCGRCLAMDLHVKILWKPKVNYCVHKSPPLVRILSQINPVHTTLSYLLKIHFNIIHPFLGLPSGLFHSGFTTNILCVFICSPFILHAPSSSSSST
jgi:hypothetical protein